MDALAAAQFRHRHFSAYPFHYDADLLFFGNRRRVARLVLRIRARADSAERVAPVISGERGSALFSFGMFTLPARSRAARVDCRLQHPSQPKAACLVPAVAASLLPVSGELNLGCVA